MRMTIESTTKIVNLGEGRAARVWEGTSEAGVPVRVYVTRIGPGPGADAEAFRREITAENRAPSPDVAALPDEEIDE